MGPFKIPTSSMDPQTQRYTRVELEEESFTVNIARQRLSGLQVSFVSLLDAPQSFSHIVLPGFHKILMNYVSWVKTRQTQYESAVLCDCMFIVHSIIKRSCHKTT